MSIVFFDIDGTLLDFYGKIPESVGPAIAAMRQNGHKAVICSGRTLGFIRDPALLALGFDGIISGCGTRIDLGKRVLSEYRFSKEEARFAVETAKQFAFPVILEGPRYLYLDREDFEGDRYVKRLEASMGEDLLSLTGNWDNWELNKFSCAINHETEMECLGTYAERFDFLRHNADVIEIVPRGYDKCTGMEEVCACWKVPQEDTFALGDSANDIGMLHWAGKGICMGSGHDIAKEAADYVTAGLWEDGVEKALKHFDLI